ncbi:MAG: GIY-YIG nuclease family protein [Patescibacteria group bacterium]
MYFVYLLQSLAAPARKYVGITDDVNRRLAEHNNGKSIHTNKFKPWELMTYIAFDDVTKAQAFEDYLKSHSGRAFSKKHF